MARARVLPTDLSFRNWEGQFYFENELLGIEMTSTQTASIQ
jgi:hypothetical protein